MSDNNEKTRVPKLGTSVLIAGIITALLSPLIFTRGWSPVSFLNTGQIGDTIGGLTAPVIGIMSSILIYLALLAQVKANEIVQGQISDQKQNDLQQKSFDSLFAIFRQVMADLDAVQVMSTRPAGPFQEQSYSFALSGALAIKETLDETVAEFHWSAAGHSFQPSNNLTWIEDTLSVFELLVTRLGRAALTELDRETLVALSGHLFQSRIENVLPIACPKCESNDHDLFPESFQTTLASLRSRIEQLHQSSG